MQQTKRRKVKKTNLKRLVQAALVLAVCVYVAVILIQQRVTLAKCGKVAEEYKDKISAAQLEQQRLEDELKQAGTDEYLERIARDKLGLVKANERVFIDITQ